ncbi:Yip1 family protein [Streptomyces sp. NBRC 109706]|uniref:Yip1 family protein n=1 Tax=Streptomyces sp. NBRC 109706 TaxID=1550035 RepID=UPI000781399D|nr:Yip1 family protein [Streptomyces sp. NBRC 109706]
MTALDDLRNAAGVEFDFAPGAQVPLSGANSGRTGLSQRIASVAYREGDPADIKEPNDGASVNKGKFSLLEPNLGEAFTRAIETRMLSDGRKPLIQSFGAEPQVVVEHALAAKRIRRQRDSRLTLIMVVFGLLFLPGVALYLGLFQLRRTFAGSQDKRAGALGTLLLFGIGGLAVLAVLRAPVDGVLQIYLWAMLPAPILGWFLARQVSERTAQNLRAHWGDLAGGGKSGAAVPEAVPQNPNDAEAERLRIGLAKLAAEQSSNLTYYAGTKGILGMGVRWGSWQLAEDLHPRDPGREIDPFRSWDVARAIGDQLRMLERGPLHTGGFTPPSIVHWVVRHVGEGAGEVSRPDGPTADGYSFSNIEVQRICNESQFNAGDRHYLGVQFVLWDGELIVTMMISVTVLHHTLRIEVSGYALGPLDGFFAKGPSPDKKKVRDFPKFWKTHEVELPAVKPSEVVRLAARAPLTWFPKTLDKYGGSLGLPEPFGLRHTWATTPWKNRFMVDDVLRTATPVLRVAHAAAFRVLRENGVDITPFDARSQALSGQIQDPGPKHADDYNM